MQIRIAGTESDNSVALSSVELARNSREQLKQLRSAQTRLLRLHKRLDALHRTLEDSIRSNAPRNQQNAVEQALALMSRRLIQVQERERARIARELHDDIGQRLSLAACTLDTLENNLSECEVRSGLRQLKEEIFEVISAVHHVSHELHPARLQYLGFVPAMQGFCKEVGDRYRMDIEFKSEDVPRSLAPGISLGLLRVLQECLTNAMKHSGVTRVQVLLRGSKQQVNLTVSDLGVGFDVKAALTGDGLGLTSMQERIRSLNGTLVVQSKPNVGTTIHACVPSKPIVDFNRMARSSGEPRPRRHRVARGSSEPVTKTYSAPGL